jgi:pimeloyl-ACP methyl ester carboxylesterase
MRHTTLRRRWPLWAALAGLTAIVLTACAQQAAASRHTVTGPAGQLAVDDGGNGGLPVLFVHSFAGSSEHWQSQLKHLRSNRRAVAMDLRGHGRSEAPRNGGYTITGFADDIAAVADGLGLQRFVLVGHSMGGTAAVAYASKQPHRVAGLVLVGAPGKASADESEKIMASLDADHDKVMAAYWETLMQGARADTRSVLEADRRKLPQDASKAMIAATFAYDPIPPLTTSTTPLLVIDTAHGDNPNALYRQLMTKPPREVITGTSHWPQLDKPDQFNRLLDAFLVEVK